MGALKVGLAVAAFAGATAVVGWATPVAAQTCGGCMELEAPTIGLRGIAQPGGQNVIDSDRGIAIYSSLTTGAAGGPGTVWLAGHRTSHGSIFGLIPTLAPGDPIDLINASGAHRYTVERLLVVPQDGWEPQVNIKDMSRSRLIIQTSHPDSTLRYLIEAFHIETVRDIDTHHDAPPACRNSSMATVDTMPVTGTTRFVAITPQRILDTRTDGSHVCADGAIEVQVAGVAGVSPDARAVALTVTTTGNTGAGVVSVGPAGLDPKLTSTLAIEDLGATRSDLVMVALGSTGRITVHVTTSTHVVIDVAGYFGESLSTREGRFLSVAPERILDSRLDPTQRRLSGGQITTIDIGQRTTSVPVMQASAVLVNITAVNSASAGFVSSWASGVAQPPVSNVNLNGTSDAATNLAIIALGPNGTVQLSASTDVDVVIDIIGYYTNNNAPAQKVGTYVPLAPSRASCQGWWTC